MLCWGLCSSILPLHSSSSSLERRKAAISSAPSAISMKHLMGLIIIMSEVTALGKKKVLSFAKAVKWCMETCNSKRQSEFFHVLNYQPRCNEKSWMLLDLYRKGLCTYQCDTGQSVALQVFLQEDCLVCWSVVHGLWTIANRKDL